VPVTVGCTESLTISRLLSSAHLNACARDAYANAVSASALSVCTACIIRNRIVPSMYGTLEMLRRRGKWLRLNSMRSRVLQLCNHDGR